MTRDDLAPLGTEDEGFPCPECKGAGSSYSYEGAIQRIIRCPDCGGSGYGPPPPELGRLRAHCLERLAKWAHRALPTEEF